MADYWDMMAKQEAGLDDDALNTWNGEAFTGDGFGLTTLGKGLLSQDQFYEMNGMTGMTAAPATSGLTVEGMTSAQNSGFQSDSFLGKAFEPIKNAMSTTDTFLRGIMGEKTLSLVYGSAIMAGAQGIMQYLNNEKSMADQKQIIQSKYAEDAKVRQEGYTREDEARARKGLTATQQRVKPNVRATMAYQAPGYAMTNIYGNMNKRNGLLGS